MCPLSEAKAGNEIRITGAGFGNGEGGSLIIGGVAASDTLSWNDTEIQALIPEGAATGTVKVMISGVESSPGGLVVLWSKENPENVAVSTAANDQLYPQLIPDGASGAIITWADRRSGTDDDLYAQRINSGGTVQWTANGVAVSTAAGDQSSGTAVSPPQILPDGSGGAIITWQDHRSGTWDIYAQGISASGRQ